ncbi:hypothetical protein ACF0H5_003854 [Mactra antiquata]
MFGELKQYLKQTMTNDLPDADGKGPDREETKKPSNVKHHPMKKSNSTPDKSYLPDYTSKDLEDLQRKDPDLSHIHRWIDLATKPSKEEISSVGPAVRIYWLNPDNIVKKDGVLYRKVQPNKYREESTLQLFVPKTLVVMTC